MSTMNPKVDFYFDKAAKWREEMEELRSIVLGCGLTEELKWGVPGYTFQQSNVALIHGFKEYCALLFVKGALLRDPNGLLIQQTENVQAGRQARFASVGEIRERAAVLTAYLAEAIEVEKAGLKVPFKQPKVLEFPEEFQRKLTENPALKVAFASLTPGRQRAYNLYFSASKQAVTRESRIEKCVPRILTGKGLND